MSLIEQIFSFFFSFIYGLLVYKLYNKFHKYLYVNKKIYSFFNSLLFMLDITLIYFLILYKINDGIIENIFVLITLFSFILFSYINLQKKCQNKSNWL